ncbi:CMD domain-containing protein [Acidovorax sp. NCPPB 3576]|uniref:CMD domain-containing protein n=1 Tax=Acidovorax sp. NCPPB 3576 TaxID=2940488 RepID=UPI00234B7347|nr:peroxidase-related enzyme [Acidovorax sp. NCPPB 3576]WCM87557.1 peroxidase-related enzyme [Acidovorax sp. NCPPB 3576]
MTDASLSPDLVDTLVPLTAGDPVHAVRHQRDKVVAATQGSYDSLFDPALEGLSLAERLLAARAIAFHAGSAPVAAHYTARLQGLADLAPAQRAALDSGDSPVQDPRLQAILRFADLLAARPVEGDREALLQLPAAGLSTPAVVALAQLIAFVAYQVRVVAGLQALAALGTPAASPAAAAGEPAPAAAPFVHPAHLPKPGEPVRVNGYTSETLEWKAWLPVLDLAQATPAQLAVLEASHPKAKTSDYYRVLVHQPRILEERSIVFNAIMYAPGGLSRAERELASAVVSRVNGCVYCASVHAQRFEQLAKRNDVIVQVFTEPQGAGTTAREQAIVQASIDLTRAPGAFGADQVRPLRAAGLSDLEILDAVHAVAIFAWANRLMLNLGEPVLPG